jgi:hypothetical protein
VVRRQIEDDANRLGIPTGDSRLIKFASQQDLIETEESTFDEAAFVELEQSYKDLQARLARIEEQARSTEKSLHEERAARAESERQRDENQDLLELFKEENEALAQKNKIATGDPSSEPSATLRPLWEGFSALLSSAQNVAKHFRRLEADSDSLADARHALEESRQDVLNLKATIESLSRRHSEIQTTVDRDQTANLIPGIASKNPSLENSLRLISTIFPERVSILESAFSSARQSSDFKFGKSAFELLWLLVTDYWKSIQESGDAQARKCFGASFAARESRKLSKAGQDRRTFDYDGTKMLMEKHLKIGTASNTSDTLRVHFEWVPNEKRIVIGHCGGHLDF